MDCVGVLVGSAVKVPVVVVVMVVCGPTCMVVSVCSCGRVTGSTRPVLLSPTTRIING